MDLQTIRENLRQKKYQSREEFLADVNQIVENSVLYNGPKSLLTIAAQRMLNRCVERLREKEDRLMRLEKAINPLLDDNDQVALTFILENVINTKLKTMSESWPFLKPVNKKFVKDYYNIIKKPMDLETISKKVASHKYHSRYEFLSDVEQILKNCEQYNGKDSPFTKKAETVVQICKETLSEYDEHLTQLEKRISIVQERALEQAEMDLGADEENYTIVEPESRDSRMSSPETVFNNKITNEDFDFVDVEGEGPPEPTATEVKTVKHKHKKKINDTLQEDLQFSSEEDFDDVPLSDADEQKELLFTQEDNTEENIAVADDDSQQAAEAMMQLGNIGFYQHSEQSENIFKEGTFFRIDMNGITRSNDNNFDDDIMDVDPNYDPSDFLMNGLSDAKLDDIDSKTLISTGIKIHDDLAVSESDDEGLKPIKQEVHINHVTEEDDGGDLWF